MSEERPAYGTRVQTFERGSDVPNETYFFVKAGEDIDGSGTRIHVDNDHVASIGLGHYVTCAPFIPMGSGFYAKLETWK